MSQPGVLTAARYGKDLVRVCRVVRDGDKHTVAEYTIRLLLEGEIETSYTEADNTCVVATDSIKNTCYIFAKTSPHVLDPPVFALHLGQHFIDTYKHITKAFVDIISLKWSRIEVDGVPHKWSFVRDGEEKGLVEVMVGRDESSVKVGVRDLLVLKTGGSSFENFYRDEYTTLQDVKDRLFSTSVTLWYTVPLPPNTPLSIENLPAIAKEVDFPTIAKNVRKATLEVFATDESASVQATQYKTLQRYLAENEAIKSAEMALPNKHYIAVNLAPFGLENGTGYEGGAEVFWPVADPSGYITSTVTRR